MTYMMEMLEGITKELSRAHAQAFDEEIYRIFGAFPNHEEVRRRSMLFKYPDYDELRVDGIPRFQQRVRFKDSKVCIEIKRC